MTIDTQTFLYTLQGDHDTYQDCQNILVDRLIYDGREYEAIGYNLTENPYDENEYVIEVICHQIAESDLVTQLVRDLKINQIILK